MILFALGFITGFSWIAFGFMAWVLYTGDK